MYKQDTKNFSVNNVCGIFEDNYIFVENFNTSSHSYQPILENVTIKFVGQRVEDRHMGPRAEGREKQIPILLLVS